MVIINNVMNSIINNENRINSEKKDKQCYKTIVKYKVKYTMLSS